MRIMQIGHSHYDYLQYFARRFKRLTSHAELMRAYLDDYYWCCHSYTPALERMGHETFVCLPTDKLSQSLWCQEHGIPLDESGVLAMQAQIEWFKPDLLYISSAAMYHDAVLEHLTWRPPCIVGWHATITQPHMRFAHYDLILSSHEECLHMAKEQGARYTAIAYPGMPTELAEKFAPRKLTDMCFSGYWAASHLRRNNFLYEFAQRAPALSMDCAYYLGFHDGGPPCPDVVQALNRGTVWGLSMFKAFATARIVLNGYATINFGPQNLSPNMRQLEALGVGSFLLTEQSDNLAAFFTEGKDLATYASTDELVEKAQYYLHHEAEREAIAAHGLSTCRRYYTMDVRAKALLDAVARVQMIQQGHMASTATLENFHQNLHAATMCYSGDTNAPLPAEVWRVISQALEQCRHSLLEGSVGEGLPLLKGIETFPIQQLKHLSLCQALRAVHNQSIPEAIRLLRQELNAYPENDAARHGLSQLALQKTFSQQAKVD